MRMNFCVKIYRIIREVFCLKLSAAYCIMENL